MATIGDEPGAVNLEENGLRDKSAKVRQMAAMQLGAMKAHDAAPALRAALDSAPSSIQRVPHSHIPKPTDFGNG